jgi:excisionase family DNA binding protein
MLDDLPPFLTVGQAATALQLGRSKVYELTVEYDRSGGKSGLPFVWFGCQKRIPRAALVAFVERVVPAVAPGAPA